MKTIIILIFAWFVINPAIMPTDYRDAYCGTYSGKRIYKCLNGHKDGLLFDTINYSISVSKNAVDSVIDIATKEGLYSVKLVSGNFTSSSVRVFGRFSNDSIYVHHVPSLAPVSYKYFAKK